MAIKNTFFLEVDIKQKIYINEPRVTQNDEVTYILRVVDDGIPFDLSNVTVFTLVSVRPDKQSVQSLGTMTANNEVTFNLGTTEIAVPGRVDATIQLYDADGRVSSIPFTYTVLKDPVSGYVPSDDEKTLIEVVLGEGPLAIQQANEARDEANQAAAYADNERQLTQAEREATALVRQATDKARVDTLASRGLAIQATTDTLASKVKADTAAAYATQEADAAKVQKEIVAQVIKDGPVASVNGQTGMVTGLAKQVEVDSLTTALADTANDIKNKTAHYERYVIESGDGLHSTGYKYTSFSSGVLFDGKEIYACRAANHHHTQVGDFGRIVLYIRGESGGFSTRILNLGTELEYRDPNISVSLTGDYLILTATGYGGVSGYGIYLWIINRDLTISQRYTISPQGDYFGWGNTLTTVGSNMIKTGYHTQTGRVVLFGNNTGSIVNPGTFSLIAEIFPASASKANECTVGYWKDKLIAITRQENGNSLYRETFDLTGVTGWGEIIDLGYRLHAPAIPTLTTSNSLLMTASHVINNFADRIPVIVQLPPDVKKYKQFIKVKTIDSVIGWGGYTSIVKNAYGYGVMYYQNHEDIGTDLFFKDVVFEDIMLDWRKTHFEKTRSLQSHFTHGGGLYQGWLFSPEKIYENTGLATDIYIVPKRNIEVSGFVTLLRSNSANPANSGVQIFNGATKLADAEQVSVTNPATSPPKVYSSSFPVPVKLTAGQVYYIRIWGQIQTFRKEMYDSVEFDDFKVTDVKSGDTGNLFKNVAIPFGLELAIQNMIKG